MTDLGNRELSVGSESQFYLQFDYHTGIQRVVRETHEYLFDFLSAHGIKLGWCRTRKADPATDYLNDSYLATTTNRVRNDILNLGWQIQAPIHVIPLGSSLPTQSSITLASNQISMLYVSTIEPRKGHDLFLDTFDLLLSRGFDVNLNLVGRYGWDREQVRSRIENHPEIGARLHWHRSADDYAMRAIARTCNIGVFPSENEGFGLFLEEGLSMGLNMVVSNVEEFTERAVPGVFYSEMNAGSLAAVILEAHQDWNASNPRGRVRSMQDFAFDLSTLILGELERGNSTRD